MPDTPPSPLPLDSPLTPATNEHLNAPEEHDLASEHPAFASQDVSAAEHPAPASVQPENHTLTDNAGKEAQPPAIAPPAPSTARMRGRRSLPDSPLERAKLEVQTGPIRTQDSDRSTMVAFGLLFVVPILIILLSLLLLLPFINSQLTEDPSGVDTQSISRGQTPTR